MTRTKPVKMIAAAALVLGLAATTQPVLAQNSNAPADEAAWLRHIAAEIARLRAQMEGFRKELESGVLESVHDAHSSAAQRERLLECDNRGAVVYPERQ